MSRRRDANRIVLEKMLDYCAEIEAYKNQVDATFEVYLSNKMFRRAVDMNILQIGELTKKLSDDFKAAHPEIPWRAIKAMRNVVVHEYDGVNLHSAWNNLSRDIPELQAWLKRTLAAEDTANGN